MVWPTLMKNRMVVPISNTLRKQAAVYPRLHDMMIRIGQWNHARNGNIHPLTKEEALKVAGDFLGHASALTTLQYRSPVASRLEPALSALMLSCIRVGVSVVYNWLTAGSKSRMEIEELKRKHVKLKHEVCGYVMISRRLDDDEVVSNAPKGTNPEAPQEV